MSERYSTNYSNLTFNEYLSKVFCVLSLGLFITTITSFLVSRFIYKIIVALGSIYTIVLLGICVAEIIMVSRFSRNLENLSKKECWVFFIVYSVLTGITLSTIFLAYDATTIFVAFGVSAIMFISMAIIGYTTNIDFSKYTSLIMPALIGLIIATIVNAIFFRSSMFDWILTYVGIIIFLFLIAYDMQKLRNYYDTGMYNTQIAEKLLIMGAFQLYLDFINLFLRILEIFGRRRKD